MPTETTTRQERATILLTFAKGIDKSGISVPSGVIFDRLMALKRWYLPRGVSDLASQAQVLFYEAGAGFRGYATVVRTGAVNDADNAILEQLGVPFLTLRLDLDEIVRFSEPLPATAHVASLSFIKNKKYWGHSFRISPRRIPRDDFETVRRLAKS